MNRAIENLTQKDRSEQLPRILMQLAIVRARQERLPESFALFRRAAYEADQAGDTALCAIGWNRLGEELLKRHRLADAEPYLLEAFRLRKLGRLPLDTSYRSLGRLRLEQGDLKSASAILDRAVDMSSQQGDVLPAWDVHQYRGRVRIAQGRLREALDDLRIAWRLARAWRWSAPRDDTGRIGAEAWVEQVNAELSSRPPTACTSKPTTPNSLPKLSRPPKKTALPVCVR